MSKASAIRAQNRQGLQLYPLQIAQVMDTAASNSLRTGIYKLKVIPPIGNFLFMSAILPDLGSSIAQAKQIKGPKHERRDLRAQNTSEGI